MNYELFIAKRIIASKQHKNSVSSPIIKISILAIAIGIIVMLFSVATGVGLQKKIKETFKDVRTRVAELNNFVQEHLTGVRITQIFNREDTEMKKFEKITENYRNS